MHVLLLVFGFTAVAAGMQRAAGLQHTLSSNRIDARKSSVKQINAYHDAPESYLIWKDPKATPAPASTNFVEQTPSGQYWTAAQVPKDQIPHWARDHSAEWADFNAALHPYLLRDMFVTQTPEMMQILAFTAGQPWVKTICESGFSAGHSAMLFLVSNPDAEVYSFGLGNQSYTDTMEKFLHRKFGDRFRLIKGNTTKTMPSFQRKNPGVKCDVMFVDGAYDEGSVRADIQNFRHMVSTKNQIMFIADTPCPASWCKGRTEAFDKAQKDREVILVKRLGVNKFHGLTSAYVTAAKPVPAVPASNFETILSPNFLAGQKPAGLL